MGKFATHRDYAGLAIVAACAAAIFAYRALYIEPRVWGGLCAGAAPPLSCIPRTSVLWLQREYLWGGFALALGLGAFLKRGQLTLCVAAVSVGIVAIANFNATWGMVGAALGLWAWLREHKQAVPS